MAKQCRLTEAELKYEMVVTCLEAFYSNDEI